MYSPCRYTGRHHSSCLARSRPSPHCSWHSSHQHRGRWRPGAEGEYCCRTQAAKGWSSQASPTRFPLGRVLRRPSTIPWSRIQATTDGLLYCIWTAVFSQVGRECDAQIYANSVYWQLLILAAWRSVTGCVMNSSVCVLCDSTGIDILPPRSPSKQSGCFVNFDSSWKLLQMIINGCVLAWDSNKGVSEVQ